MHWKEMLDKTTLPDFRLSAYAMPDEAKLDRKESHLETADYQALLADVFVPAIEEFRAELEKRGEWCETHKARASTSLVVSYRDKREIKFAFTVEQQGMRQSVKSQFLTATWRVDTKAGKITKDDVLLCLAGFYVTTRRRD